MLEHSWADKVSVENSRYQSETQTNQDPDEAGGVQLIIATSTLTVAVDPRELHCQSHAPLCPRLVLLEWDSPVLGGIQLTIQSPGLSRYRDEGSQSRMRLGTPA